MDSWKEKKFFLDVGMVRAVPKTTVIASTYIASAASVVHV